jgi:hypothetical protein
MKIFIFESGQFDLKNVGGKRTLKCKDTEGNAPVQWKSWIEGEGSALEFNARMRCALRWIAPS